MSFTKHGSKEELKCSHLGCYSSDTYSGFSILSQCNDLISCHLQSFLMIGYDAVDGLGTNPPSCWTEDTNVCCVACRQRLLELLEETISAWGFFFSQFGYFSCLLKGILHYLTLFQCIPSSQVKVMAISSYNSVCKLIKCSMFDVL